MSGTQTEDEEASRVDNGRKNGRVKDLTIHFKREMHVVDNLGP